MKPTIKETADDGRVSAPQRPEPVLVCLGSAEDDFVDAGRVWRLGDVRRVEFGRGAARGPVDSTREESTLRMLVSLPWVSGSHCEVQLGDGSVRLRDHDSRNGTRLRDSALHGEAALEAGDVFEVGRSFWTVRPAREHEDAGERDLMPPVRYVRGLLGRVAESSVPVILVGETGTGKASLAAAIHAASGRDGELVSVRLGGATPSDLVSMFGGSGRRSALLKRARSGTLYFTGLDELGSAAQSRLLALLPAEGHDVRLIAACTADLREQLAARRFQPELFARLATLEVEIPPVRHCLEDIGLAVASHNAASGVGPLRLSTRALRYAVGFAWPFNRRQVLQMITTLTALRTSDGPVSEAVIRDVLRGTELSMADVHSDP